MIAFFEVITTSAPHIYHSALPLSPRTSIVHKLYQSYSRPLARVVRGLPISWESITTIVRHRNWANEAAVWSPCSRFIAVAQFETIEILDAVTRARLDSFKHPGETLWLSVSPDSRSLTHLSHGDYGLTTWDLQTGGRIGANFSPYHIHETLNRPHSPYFSSAYSVDEKMIAVACRDMDNPTVTVISTYNLLSRTHIFPSSLGRTHRDHSLDSW